jgi:hypothetical protein
MRASAIVAVVVSLIALFRIETAGAAESEAALARITEINRSALRLVQQSDFGSARKALKEALELCDSQGLGQHPIKARTHIHLGAVLVRGFEQRELGIKQFQKARQIQPEIRLTPDVASPGVEQAFAEASGKAPGETTAKGMAAAAPEAGAAGAPVAAAADEDQPSTAPAPRAARRARDDDDDDDDDAAADEQRKFFVALSIGSGVGWATGNADLHTNRRVENAGFALAQLGHIAPEVGYWLSPRMRISVEGRLQGIVGPTDIMDNGRTYQAANYAAAGFAKASWLVGGSGKLQPFVTAAVGGGNIRHVVTFSTLRTCGASGMETCVDTVAAGPLLLGGGAGLLYDLGNRLALMVALNTQLGAPRFTFNFDGNVGLAMRL